MKRYFIFIAMLSLGIVQVNYVQAMQMSKIPNVTKIFVKGGLTIAGICATAFLVESVHRNIKQAANFINRCTWSNKLKPGYIAQHFIDERVAVYKGASILGCSLGALVGSLTCWAGWSLIKDLRKRFGY